MSKENDDKIRESIPCVTVVVGDDVVCVPEGYSLNADGDVFYRGREVHIKGVLGDRLAWDHAVAREKARRQREGQVSAADKANAMLVEVTRERDEANAMLVEVTRERDALRTKLERVRVLDRWYLRSYNADYDGPTQKDDDGDCVLWDDLAFILGKDGEASTDNSAELAEVTRERDKATAMLGEVTRQRDATAVDLKQTRRELTAASNVLKQAIAERDELREKLTQVRNVQRLAMASMRVVNGHATVDWIGDEDGDYVRWLDLAVIVDEDYASIAEALDCCADEENEGDL